MTNTIISRRTFILASGSATALFLNTKPASSDCGGGPTLCKTPSFDVENGWQETLEALVGTSSPASGPIFLRMDTITDGAAVPFEVIVDSPMTKEDHVQEIHLVTTANPNPKTASYYLTPALGAAHIKSRMRLAGTQDVYAVAKMNRDRIIGTKMTVKCA